MGDSLVSPGIALPALQGVIGNIVNFIIQRFGSDSGLASALQLVHQRGSKGYIRTARHAELELLQAAHVRYPRCLPSWTLIRDPTIHMRTFT